MNITEMLGSPVNDPVEFEPSSPAGCSSAPRQPSSPPPSRPRRRVLLTSLLVGALAIGLGIGWYLGTGDVSNPIEPAIPPADVVAPPQIGDFAEMFTALYLSGLATPKDLGSMYTGSMPAAAGTWVNQSAALAVEPLTSGFWQVAIAVDALELIDGAYESAGIQYFELTVADKTPYPVAVSAPARIPPPANVGEDGASDFTGTVPSDQAAAVSHFVNGYLTGQEDIARYVTPTARIQLFAEPPYASATITSLGSDELGNVTVAVSAVTNGGAMHPLQYTVALSFEAGVWEVADLTSVVGLE